MAEPIYTTSYLGIKTKVFPTHVSYKVLIGSEITIPLKQIASIEVGMKFDGKVRIETSGGKKHTLLVKFSDKEALRDAIYGVMNS